MSPQRPLRRARAHVDAVELVVEELDDTVLSIPHHVRVERFQLARAEHARRHAPKRPSQSRYESGLAVEFGYRFNCLANKLLAALATRSDFPI